MTVAESYADEPITITALRANKTDNGSHWTPRDALIDVLRQIDKGEISPDALCVVWCQKYETGGGFINYSSSADSGVTTLGLLARAAYRVNVGMDPD